MARKKAAETKIPDGRKEERDNREYTVGLWAGVEQFACSLCAFDVLEDRKAMLEHLMNEHGSEQALEELVRLELSASDAPAEETSESAESASESDIDLAAPEIIPPEAPADDEDVFESMT